MKSASKKQLRRTILCALFAGVIAAPFAAPHAYALPIEGANAATNAGEANISTSGAVMDITGKTEHNVLRWEDFSIDSGEKVRFDGGAQTRDYLNLVTGEGASNIYGTIEGGRNVYLVNPHGILFAKDSQVNTGALCLSTANPADIATATETFKTNGTSPLSASAQMGDVLNLGTVKASKLYIEGKNVTVLNTDAVTDTNGTALTGSAVTIRSAEIPHIGYDVGNKITKNIKVGSTPTPYQVSDYASTVADHRKASAESRGWVVQYLNGEPHADYDYMRVHDVYELQHIEANLRGRYMLANDINAGETSGWNQGIYVVEGFKPIGGNGSSGPKFTGRFDGVGHRIEHLHINRQEADENSYIGLFGNVKGALVENLSIVDGYVRGDTHVGGIVGAAEGTPIRNVSFSGTLSGSDYFGGIVGTAKYGMICNAYNAGKVDAGTYVGGIVGAGERVTLQNVWNAGEIIGGGDGSDAFIGGIAGAMKNSTVQNALHTGTVARDGLPGQGEAQTVGGIVGQADGGTVSHAVWKAGSVTQGCSPTFIAHAVGEVQNNTAVEDDAERSEADMKKAATYTDWKDENGNALVATAGGKGTPWRIYDGKTTPMLTALMKGTKRLEKVYDGKTFGDGDAHIISDTPLEKNAGTYDARGIYSDAFGYDLIGSTYRIAPRVLTMSGVASQTKVYDGTTAADAAQFSATLNNVVTGEESLVSATATGAAYNSKDVATANKVNYALALSGTGAGNYTLAATTVQGAGTISRRALTLGTVAAQTKTYDGTTAADAGKFRAALTNAIAGDSVAATATGAAYNSKDVAGANTVNYTGVALGGADAGNYSLDAVAQGTGTITRRALTFDAVAAQTKIYDGTTAADTSKFHATLGNLVAGEENSVSATATGATYNDKNVAGANKVSYTGVALGGTGAGNYAVSNTTEGQGRITPKQLTLALTGGARFDKTYDGTANVTQTLTKGTNYSLTGFIGTEGDHLALAAATGAYTAGKDAGTDKEVTFKNLTLTGMGAGNYTLDKTALTGIGTIARRTLTLGAVESQSKTYDGTTAADAGKFRAALTNAIAGDSVTAAATGATYNDKNVAGASRINYTGVALAGADAGNYTLAATAAQGAGTITRRMLTASAVGAQTKTYDGTRTADAAAFHATLGNVVAGEENSVAATAAGAAYNDKNVARANAVNYTGVALTGTGAGNYAIADTAQGAGTITRRALTLGAVAAQTKTYDGTTAADASKFGAALNNAVAGDNVSTTATGAAYNDKNVAAANRIDYTGVALTGADAGNYSLAATTAQGTGTIAKRTLTVGSVTAQTKTYDGTTAADASKFRATLNNVVAGEENLVSATAAGAAYNDKNVARANAVGYTGVALAGAGAGNYTIADTAQGTGTITQRALTLGAVTSEQTKTYDGTTTADASKFRAVLNNVVTGEENLVKATATGAAYNSKDVATANAVNYTGVQLTGTGVGNYTLAATTAQGTGSITRRELTVDTVAAQSKTYDGTIAADTSKFQATLNNVVAGEESSVTAIATGAAYNDKNVVGANRIDYTGIALTGTGAANYAVADTAQGAGTITQRALTLGAVEAQTKTYDGTRAADASKFRAVLNNVVAGDSVTTTATGAAYNSKDVAAANAVNYTGVQLTGTGAGNYTLAATTAQGAGTITPRDLTLTANAKSIVQGEALPSFTGRADGFADGEDGSVFGADGVTFMTAVTDTNTPGSYAVIGKAGGMTDGVLGNYRIRQAAGNATAFTIHAAALPGGLLASLVQDAAPRFDFGFGDTAYLYGNARPIRALTLGFYRFDAERAFEIQGLRL